MHCSGLHHCIDNVLLYMRSKTENKLVVAVVVVLVAVLVVVE